MKISLKQLLLIMIGVAFVMAILSLATRGDTFALGITISLAGLTLLFSVYQSVFFVLYVLAKLGFLAKNRSNFASEEQE